MSATLTAIRPRGRPADPETAEDARDDATARAAERQEAWAEVIELSRFLFRDVAIDGDRPAMGAAARIHYIGERELRRDEPPETAA